MFFTFISIGLTVGLFVGMLVLLEIGLALGRRRRAMDPDEPQSGAIDGAVFALLGLLIAFTFSGAASRFDTRRQLVVEEVNSIGTVWLRLELVPKDKQPQLRELMRQYVDSRLDMYRSVHQFDVTYLGMSQTAALESEIWEKAVDACQAAPDQRASLLLLPALNTMFDLPTTRAAAATRMHPPTIIFVLLIVLSLGCALLAGHGMAEAPAAPDRPRRKMHPWIHPVGFALVLSITLMVILDLEFPRVGIIRIDSIDQMMVDVRASMN